MRRVPLFDLSPIHKGLHDQFLDACDAVIHSGNFILGHAVEKFEWSMAQCLGCKFTLGVSSGSDALLLALMALDIRTGDEILCPSFTFFATASCVVRLGAIPVWVDVRAEDFGIDVEDAERKVSPKTKAIIPVHLFGQCCDCQAVQGFAQRHALWIVEDVAQAQGAQYNRRQAGSWSTMSAFSFFPTKNLGGLGDGGLVATNDVNLAEKARCLRVHGAARKYEHIYLGGNFRMDSLQAALLNVKLPYVDNYTQQRRHNAQLYQRQLGSLEPFITLPKELPHRYHTWNQYTIRVHNHQRNALKSFLEEHGVESAVYYPKTLDLQTCMQNVSTDKGIATHVAHTLADEVLSLPIFPGLTLEQLEYTCATIRKFFTKQ
ncbi:MAG: DegT/DnrJ/EryC1/StrS family aminotransferase [Puniceicoccales bacterium]|jgi:dTDP-4-amino-4,6-dideoxygalactose transaminase|nr:DegT/DnrJ/EryC1/StrS family aminotransferase [Puniceicoccales bacterium]